ncbi:unnamed protein product [Didymodactylos carnosus]|uniref:Uncharacterized protein n=2 Tax=Didymodactylos carnosus TaxID=1234261 RepID=A0A813P0L6_9BILA|nr:unnamed protein product [Didymodactylos carnosus]CAF3520060.1 unnamed protein product [Didymodactylos carnosus]
MSSLFDISINGNKVTEIRDNNGEPIDCVKKLCELCPTLEIIDDKLLHDENKPTLAESGADSLTNVEKELKDMDSTLENCITDIQTQFNVLFNDLNELKSTSNDEILDENDDDDDNNNNSNENMGVMAETSFIRRLDIQRKELQD